MARPAPALIAGMPVDEYLAESERRLSIFDEADLDAPFVFTACVKPVLRDNRLVWAACCTCGHEGKSRRDSASALADAQAHIVKHEHRVDEVKVYGEGRYR